MTLLHEPAPVALTTGAQGGHEPQRTTLWGYVTTTNHKTIGVMYTCSAFFFFILSGLMAETMRAELARPGLQFVSNEQYNRPWRSGSPTSSSRCRSARPTCPFPG